MWISNWLHIFRNVIRVLQWDFIHQYNNWVYVYPYLLGDLSHSEWKQHHHIHLPDIVKGYCTVVFSGEHWIPRCNSVRPNGAHIRWRMVNWTTICETHSLGNTTLLFLSFVWISLSQVAYTAKNSIIQLIRLHNCIPMLKKNKCWNWMWSSHYNDVIMTTIASQITSLTVVWSTVYSDAD